MVVAEDVVAATGRLGTIDPELVKQAGGMLMQLELLRAEQHGVHMEGQAHAIAQAAGGGQRGSDEAECKLFSLREFRLGS